MERNANVAKDIVQRLLEQTGDALMSGDFEAFAKTIALPHRIETFEGSDTLHTKDDVERRFNAVRAYFRNNSVTELVRHVIEADFKDHDTIHATHQTRVLSGITLVQAPYPNLTVVKQIDGLWRAETSQYAIADSDRHNAALIGVKGPPQTGETDD